MRDPVPDLEDATILDNSAQFNIDLINYVDPNLIINRRATGTARTPWPDETSIIRWHAAADAAHSISQNQGKTLWVGGYSGGYGQEYGGYPQPGPSYGQPMGYHGPPAHGPPRSPQGHHGPPRDPQGHHGPAQQGQAQPENQAGSE